MSKAEQFIRDYTRTCSNEMTFEDGSGSYNYVPWLTPDQARKAVEIAREEMIEWLEKNIYMYNGECEGDRKEIINDIKQAMKDE